MAIGPRKYPDTHGFRIFQGISMENFIGHGDNRARSGQHRNGLDVPIHGYPAAAAVLHPRKEIGK